MKLFSKLIRSTMRVVSDSKGNSNNYFFLALATAVVDEGSIFNNSIVEFTMNNRDAEMVESIHEHEIDDVFEEREYELAKAERIGNGSVRVSVPFVVKLRMVGGVLQHNVVKTTTVRFTKESEYRATAEDITQYEEFIIGAESNPDDTVRLTLEGACGDDDVTDIEYAYNELDDWLETNKIKLID